jgi:Asp/Glu/hydantoin racemase
VRRLLVVNPNGNVAVNDLVRDAAARVLGSATTARVVNPPLSPLSIETLEDRRRAEPLALELLSQHRGVRCLRHGVL